MLFFEACFYAVFFFFFLNAHDEKLCFASIR